MAYTNNRYRRCSFFTKKIIKPRKLIGLERCSGVRDNYFSIVGKTAVVFATAVWGFGWATSLHLRYASSISFGVLKLGRSDLQNRIIAAGNILPSTRPYLLC